MNVGQQSRSSVEEKTISFTVEQLREEFEKIKKWQSQGEEQFSAQKF